MRAFGPAPRNDPAYIMQLASALMELRGRLVATITRVTGDYLANLPGEVILVDASGGDVDVSLPSVKEFYGLSLSVKKMDASGNTVTITPQSGETVDGDSSESIATQYLVRTVLSTGTEWVII